MTRLFIDIETIPDQREGAAQAATSRIQAPSNYKDPDKIKAYVAEKGAEAWRKTSLDGSYGQVYCIGVALDDEPAGVFVAEDYSPEAEAALLEEFWESLPIPKTRVTWVGHNVLGFDLPFLWKRHVIRQVQPRLPIPYNAGAWSDEIEDTMLMWTGQRTQFMKLDELLSVLGIPSGDPIEGSEVWDWLEKGEKQVVVEHCVRNVDETRQAWIRMKRATLRR